MTDLLHVLRLVTARLDEAGVPYMVSGSLALGYYAVPRMTRDIDIVVDLGRGDVPRLVDVFSTGFYCDRDAVTRAVESRRLVNLIHLDSAYKIDLIIRKDTPYRLAEFERRRRLALGDFEVWMATAEDLLLSKLVWADQSHSDLQRRDAAAIVASVPALDWAYLDQWSRQLGVVDALRELRP